jgi:hypothetical protein
MNTIEMRSYKMVENKLIFQKSIGVNQENSIINSIGKIFKGIFK